MYNKKVTAETANGSSDDSDNSDGGATTIDIVSEAATAPATLQPGDESSMVGVSISGNSMFVYVYIAILSSMSIEHHYPLCLCNTITLYVYITLLPSMLLLQYCLVSTSLFNLML